MKDEMYKEYYPIIIDMVRTMGIECTDDYLKQELSNITKNVICLREKILHMEDCITMKTNTDQLTHLKYDIENTKSILNNLLRKLETADKRFICFKEYMRRNKREL